MSTIGLVQLLFAALAFVMVGLGLSLDVSDFQRLVHQRRAVVLAMALQMIVLPLAALAIALAMHLDRPYAVGLMLLAAAPGSISSNLYSHVFGGNVALNMSLTGLNTLFSVVTLPLICSWSLTFFSAGPDIMPVVGGKLMEAMATLILPVIAGMAIRRHFPRFAHRAEKPTRIFSIVILVAFSAAAIIKEWFALTQGMTQVGLSVVLFNLLSLFGGYWVSRQMALPASSAVAISFQLGVRSAVLSIYIAMTVLNNTQMALPAAVYSLTMVLLGLSFGVWAKRRPHAGRAQLLLSKVR